MPIDPAIPRTGGATERVFERLAALERRIAVLEANSALPVVAALPAAGRAGRVVMLASDGKLYRDTGAAWILNS